MKLNIQLFAASKSTTFSEPALTDAMISGNYSTLKITIKFSANNSSTYFNSKTLNCTCNGTSQSAKVSLSAGGKVTKTFTFTNIPHNEDGTKRVSWSWNCNTGTSVLGNISDSGTRVLQEIKRLAYFSGDKITGNTIMEESPSTLTLHYDIYNFDYTYKYLYSYPNGGSYTGNLTPTSLTDNTKALPFNYNIFLNNPNANDLDINFRVQTYNGDVFLGSDSYILNVTLSPNEIPNISVTNTEEINPTMQSLNWGVYVKNKSQLKVTSRVTGSLGTNIESSSMTIDNKSYVLTESPTLSSPYYEASTSILTSAGANTITETCIDARQRTNTITETINVVDYENPSLTTFEVQRCLSDGTIDKNGTYLKYSAVGSISPVANNNSSTFRLGYKIQGTNNYTYVTLGSGYTLNITNEISSFTISSNDIYDIVLEAVDSFTTSKIERVIDVGFDLLNFNASGKAMAIGKVSTALPNEELLEIGLETDFENDVTMESDLSVDGTINQIGNLAALNTSAKNNIVSAINELTPYVLFTDTSGDTSDITLSKSSANFKYIEVYYKYDTSDTFGEYYSKINEPNGKTIALNMMLDNNNYCYQLYCPYSISGTTMTKGTAVQWRTSTTGSARTTPNVFAITKVIGYK